MTLSPEDRARIYEEEKARLEAREALLKPRRRKRIAQIIIAAVGAMLIGIILIVIWVWPEVMQGVARSQLDSNSEARSAFAQVSSVMGTRPEVLRIGALKSVKVMGPGHWRFEVDAVYKTDAGIIERGTLIAKASQTGAGWDVELNRK